MNLKIANTGKEPDYSERLNAIYDGSHTNSFFRLNYQVFGMIRRVILVGMLIFLKGDGLSQIIAYMTQSIIFTMYLFFCRPLEDTK